MEKQKHYLTQYCDLHIELKNKDVHEFLKHSKQLLELFDKAIVQSGLTFTEVTLICMCRKYDIMTKVNTYAYDLSST